MKYTIISAEVGIAVILILYMQFGKKNKNEIPSKQSAKHDLRKNLQDKGKRTSETLKEINKADYIRFILTKKTSENYLLDMIKEYGELSGNEEYQIYNFGIAEYLDWKIIKVDESISFYVYHNLVGWLNGYEENPEIPEFSIGFSKNKKNSKEDYLFYLDPENEYGDTQIGAFRNGESFSIYLPEAYKEYGNLTIKNEIRVSMKETIDFIAELGLNVADIGSFKYMEHQIKMNE